MTAPLSVIVDTTTITATVIVTMVLNTSKGEERKDKTPKIYHKVTASVL